MRSIIIAQIRRVTCVELLINDPILRQYLYKHKFPWNYHVESFEKLDVNVNETIPTRD